MNAYRENKLRYIDSVSIDVLENSIHRPGLMVDLHWHDYYELLYIMEGSGEQLIGGLRETLCPGDIVLVKPGAEHSTLATDEGGCIIVVVLFYLHGMNFDNVLALQSQHLLSFLNNTPERGGFVSHLGRQNPEVVRVAQMLRDESQNKRKGYETVTKGLLYQMLGYLIRDGQFEAAPVIPQEQLHAIGTACAYIEANYTRDISLEYVAQYVGFNPEYMSRLFKKVVGRNFKAYCDYVRMREADRLLYFQRLSVQEVSQRVGYQSASEFLRAYKRVNGCTPSENINRNCLI